MTFLIIFFLKKKVLNGYLHKTPNSLGFMFFEILFKIVEIEKKGIYNFTDQEHTSLNKIILVKIIFFFFF